MGRKRAAILISLLLCSLSTYCFAKNCETHEVCVTGEKCECEIGAEETYDRYYYFDIPHIKKGTVYDCQFNSSPSSVTLVENKLPDGAEAKCTGSCSHFPIEFHIDTQSMLADEGIASMKYFVPASKWLQSVSAFCQSYSAG